MNRNGTESELRRARKIGSSHRQAEQHDDTNSYQQQEPLLDAHSLGTAPAGCPEKRHRRPGHTHEPATVNQMNKDR